MSKSENYIDPFDEFFKKQLEEDLINNVEWEFHQWVEKGTGECWLIGFHESGMKYQATGIMGAGEIVEVRDPELYFE